MDSSKTKIILHYKYLAKKYKLPYEAADKTVKDLKQEISKRLKAQKVDASPEDFDIEDSNGSILFEEDSVLDLLQNDDELEVKSSHPQNAPILSQPDLSMIIEEFTIQVIPTSGQEFTLKTKEEESIAKVLQEICTLEKLDAEQHILTLGLFELDSDKTLKNYNITKGSKLGIKKKQQQLVFKPLFSQGPNSFSSMFKNSSSDPNLFSSKPVQDSTSLWSSTVQTQKPPAVQQKDDDKFSYLFSLPKQNALNNILQQHLQLNNLSSSLDANALNNVSNSNALNSSKSVNNQNISNTGNSLDYVSRYQPSKMQTGLLEKPEEEMVSNFVPESTFKMEEEKKDFIEESDRIVLNYRIIQGRDPEEIKKLAWKKSSNLENLSTHILNINGYKTENFRGALYTEEGIPLSRSLVEMINIKTGDLLRDNDTIYVILASFNVDDTTFPKLNHEEGTEQVFVRSSQTYVVNVDIKTTTVRELKQKIYSKLDIVTSVQALSYGGKPLTDANVLEDYNMHPHSTITLGIRAVASGESYGFTGNFYTPSLVHTKPQSGRGLREFRSHMIALFGQLRDPQLAQKYSVPLLGLIRDLSDNNAPLVNALYVLLGNGSLKLTHKIALEEGMLNLFSKLVLRSSERPKGFESSPEEVFEHTRPILSALISFINALPNVPQVWSDRENFKAAETQCQLTFQILKKPAHLKFDDGSKKICERTAVEKKIAAGDKIAGIAELTLDKIEELPEVQRQVDLLRACHVNEMDIWTPKDKNMTKFEQSNKFNLTNWEALCNQADKIPFLKIYKSLELKNNAPAYCLTLNSRGKLILYMGKNKDVSKPIDTYDAITGATENINADDVASQLAAQANQIKIEKSITRPPKEAIMVLLDVSGSMKKDYFDSVSMMRIGAVKAFFNAFADRTMAYDFHHVVSLVFFNSEIKMICDFTEVLNQFKYALDSATPSGTTKLYDSIIYAVEKLNEFKAQYPTSIRRIICLTDGEDYGSKNRAWRAARMVQDAGIVLDSFVVGPECEGLKTITFATGGFCYCPQEINEAMRLFEGETILRAGIREKRASQELVTSENDLTALKNKSFTTELIPMQLPEKINEPVVKPKALIQHIAASQAQMLGVSPPRRLKRIVKEIYHYTSNPHPYIQIFPGKEDITFWKILLKGPEKTPYENGTFILYANFPEKYPNEAPNIRFLTEIYHCNINSNGRICHSVFDRNYTIDTTIKVIFDCIYGLLLTPEPEDPLDNTLATEFLSERPKYEENARKLTKSKATKDNDALMLEFLGFLSIPKESKEFIGAEMNSGLQDEELLAKMKEFEDWLNK